MTAYLPKGLVAVAGVIALALLWNAEAGAPGEPLRAAAIGIFCISLWATAMLGIGLTALVFFLIAILVGVPLDTVFAGFKSSAFWLVFGGIVIGVAVKHTGLGDRLVNAIVRHLPPSYPLILAGVATAAIALAFVMPSSFGRIVLLLPVVTALADQLGFRVGSNGRNGMVLTAAFVGFLPAGGILPALVPGMVLAGSAETLYGVTISWAGYFVANFPVGGVIRGLMVVAVMIRLFPAQVEVTVAARQLPPAPLAERLLGIVLLCSLILWCTDTLHGISPGWVGLGAGIVCLWPGLGLVPPRALSEKLDGGSLFYVAGVLGLGGLIATSGLADSLADALLSVVHLGSSSFADIYTLNVLGMVLATFVTSPALPAVMTPLADTFVDATGLPLMTVLMSQVIGYSNVAFPYQAAPVLVALQLGGVSVGPATKATVILSVLTIVFIVPLTYVWWQIIGLV